MSADVVACDDPGPVDSKARKDREIVLEGEVNSVIREGVARALDLGLVPNLVTQASPLAGENDEGRVEELLWRAIAATNEDTSDVIPFAHLWLGLDAGTRGKTGPERRAVAFEEYRAAHGGTAASFRTNKTKQLRRALARTLIALELPDKQPLASQASNPSSVRDAPQSAARSQQESGRSPYVAFAIVSTFVVAIGAALAIGFANRTGDAETVALGSVAELARSTQRQLTLRETPAPGHRSPQLGFGDSVGGREAIPWMGANTQTSPTPQFNSLVDLDSPVVGGATDERVFVVGKSVDVADLKSSTTTSRSAFTLRPGEVAAVLVYVSNTAPPQSPCTSTAGPWVARESRLRVSLWTRSDRSLHVVRGWISANNTVPRWVTAAVAIRTPERRSLRLQPKLSYQFQYVPSALRRKPALRDDSVLRSAGMRLGTDGNIGGCADNRVYVVLAFR